MFITRAVKVKRRLAEIISYVFVIHIALQKKLFVLVVEEFYAQTFQMARY